MIIKPIKNDYNLANAWITNPTRPVVRWSADVFFRSASHNISNEAERASKFIYHDFKLKKPLVSIVYINIFPRCMGYALFDSHWSQNSLVVRFSSVCMPKRTRELFVSSTVAANQKIVWAKETIWRGNPIPDPHLQPIFKQFASKKRMFWQTGSRSNDQTFMQAGLMVV